MGTFRSVRKLALPLSLAGESPALAFPSLAQFRVAGGAAAATTFEALYEGAVDEAMRSSGHDAFESLDAARTSSMANAPPRNGAEYPKGVLGKRLADLARLIHADVGLRLGVTEMGGFDTHLAQGAGAGQLANRLQELSEALAAFAVDLGPKLDDVVVTTVTEFGRTAHDIEGTGNWSVRPERVDRNTNLEPVQPERSRGLALKPAERDPQKEIPRLRSG